MSNEHNNGNDDDDDDDDNDLKADIVNRFLMSLAHSLGSFSCKTKYKKLSYGLVVMCYSEVLIQY